MATDDDTTDGLGARPASPPTPPGAPSDWASVVHASGLADLARLGRWTGGTTPVRSGEDPSPHFVPVRAQSLGGGASPGPIYVVVHGWAPGYATVVRNAGGTIWWWGPNASTGTPARWASDWCWSEVVGPRGPRRPGLIVDDTGVVQQITAFDSTATVLAYSWIDDSATDSGTLHLDEVYSSEAYTHLNGIRLANALEAAIDSSFFAAGGQIRLIGHSHGSRVGTVAALTLQQRGHPATHLTILDSPESELTLAANGANLLGVYLDQLRIGDPSGSGGGMYVESLASYFGVTYTSADPHSPIGNVVQIGLNPGPVYGSVDPSDSHTYAAAWYGGAAAAAAAKGDPAIGLAWPPVTQAGQPTIVQRWGAPGQDQWRLTGGASRLATYRYATHPLAVTEVGHQGGVAQSGGTVTLTSAGAQRYSIYEGRYDTSHHDQYGIAFDVGWRAPRPGAFLVVAVGHEDWSFAHTLLVLDGASVPPRSTTSIAVNADVWSPFARDASLRIFYWSGPSTADTVQVSDLRYVEVSGP